MIAKRTKHIFEFFNLKLNIFFNYPKIKISHSKPEKFKLLIPTAAHELERKVVINIWTLKESEKFLQPIHKWLYTDLKLEHW